MSHSILLFRFVLTQLRKHDLRTGANWWASCDVMMNGSQRLKRSHLLARGWMQATPKVGTRSNFFMILAAAFSTQVMATAWMEGPPPHHTQLQYILTFWSSSHAHNSYLASTDWKVLLTLHFRRKSNLDIILFNSFVHWATHRLPRVGVGGNWL